MYKLNFYQILLEIFQYKINFKILLLRCIFVIKINMVYFRSFLFEQLIFKIRVNEEIRMIFV